MLKKILLILLAFISLISVVHTAGTTYCAPIENGKIPDGTVGKKFNPGHYILLPDGYHQHKHDVRMDAVRRFIDYPEIKGLEVFYYWAELEVSEGNYNWQIIYDALDEAKAHDKHIMLSIYERSFGTNGCEWGDLLVPQYVIDSGGLYVDETGRCMPRMWDHDYMTKYIRFLNAIGEEFDDHPNFEMLRIVETALAWPQGGTYDLNVYNNQLVRMFEETKPFYENTIVSLEINWAHNIPYIIEEAIVKNGGGLSWPDPFPCRWTCERPESQDWAENNKGKIVIAPRSDTHELFWGESDDVYNFYVNDLESTHVSWVHLFGNAYEPGVYRDDFVDAELVPVLRANNLGINTNCPSVTGTCLDTSNSCTGASAPNNLCNQISEGGTVPAGFGAPYDPDNNQMRFNVMCEQSSANLKIGSSSSGLFIYKYGYVWRNNNWEQVELTGEYATGSNVWILDQATGVASGVDISLDNYALTYMCKWTGSQWKCGCSDQSCSRSMWNLQIFKE